MTLDHGPVPTSRAAWIASTVAGVGLGVACLLSPASLWFAAIAALLVAWAARGLDGRERQAVIGLLAVSLVVRVLVIAAFFLATDHVTRPWGVMIGDERQIIERSEWLRNIATGVELAPTDWIYAFQQYGNSGLPYVFAYMFILFGVSPYAAHLVNVVLAVGGAVLLHKTLRRAYGPIPAYAALILLLCVPTFFVWSISALKESSFFFLVAVAIAALDASARHRSILVKAAALVLAYYAVQGVAEIRPIGMAVCAGGFGLGIAMYVATRRAWLAVASVAVGAVVAWQLLQRPDVQTALLAQFRVAGVTHIGNVLTTGYAYKLLDPHYYTRWAMANTLEFMTLEDSARYAVRAAASFVTVPTPWQVVSTPALAFLPQQVLWYVGVVFAVVGVASGLRRDAWLTLLLAGYCLAGAGLISLPSGNIGTFIRMRDMVSPIVYCLSALGGSVVLDAGARWALGRRAHVPLEIRPEESHATA